MKSWREKLRSVKPATVIGWHRKGWRYYWRRKSRQGKPGRPRIDLEIIELIRRMSKDNGTWGAPRIKSELALLGHEIAESTVAKYMVRHTKKPSQTWRTFLANHMTTAAACDFFVVPSLTFKPLYCFVVLTHDRRKIVHVTSRSTRRPSGRRSRSSKRSPVTATFRDTFIVIATRSTAAPSRRSSWRWESNRRSAPGSRPGRTRTSSASSVRFAESARITSSLLANAICCELFWRISATTIRPAVICLSIETRPNLAR